MKQSDPSDPRIVAEAIRMLIDLADVDWRRVIVQHELANLWTGVPDPVRQSASPCGFPQSKATWAAVADQLAQDGAGVADASAYIPAKDAVDGEYVTDYKGLHSILDQHPEIRHYKPSQNRLMIHAGDWNTYKRQFEAVIDEPAVAAVIDVIEQRKAKARGL